MSLSRQDMPQCLENLLMKVNAKLITITKSGCVNYMLSSFNTKKPKYT